MKRRLRQAMSLLLAIVLCFGQLPYSQIMVKADETDWSDYAGQITLTEGGVYEIHTAAELAAVAKGINEFTLNQYMYDAEEDKILYYTFRLEDDLDLSAHQWVPIGSNNQGQFNAVFDGQGHTITGLTIGSKDAPYKDGYYAGLFGSVGGQITDVKITNAKVYASAPPSGSYTYAGLIAGSLYGSNASVSNCEVSGFVYTGGTTHSNSDYGAAGGLIGSLEQGVVDACRADVTAGFLGTDESFSLGGIVGTTGENNISVIKNCVARISVDVASDITSSWIAADGIAKINGKCDCENNSSQISYKNLYPTVLPDDYYDGESKKNICTIETTGGWEDSATDPSGIRYRYYAKDGSLSEVTAEEMKSAAFLQTLNSAASEIDGAAQWRIEETVNNGYPDIATAGLHDFCKVSFVSNNQTIATQNLIGGNCASQATAPEREGYTFLYWYAEDEEAAFDFATPVTKDLVLTAKWDPHQYTIRFESVGGSYIYPQSVARDQKAVMPDAPLKKGSTFGGWYTDRAYTTAYSFDSVVTSDVTLYAKWTGAEALPSISGHITDKSTGEGIQGASVALDNGQNAITDTFGYYRITDVEAGTYQITATAPEYQAGTQEGFTVGDVSAGFDAALSKKENSGAKAVNVYATVSCVYSGLMLGGVEVKAVGAGELGTYTQRTDENGFALFTGLPAGSYTFTINKSGLPGWESYVSNAQELSGDYNLNCQLKPNYQSVTVSVKGSYDPITETANVPLSGVTVKAVGMDPKDASRTLVNLSAVTDENGKATFDKLVPISWTFSAETFAYTNTEATIYANGAGKYTVSELPLTLPFEESSLSVNMTSVYEDPDIFKMSKDEKPATLKVELAGVVGTTAEGIVREATLNEDGKAVFNKLFPGTYRMTASGAAKKYVSVTSSDGKEIYGQSSGKKYFEVDFDGRGTANVGLGQAATATLTVTPSPVNFSGTLYKSDMNEDGSISTVPLANTSLTLKPSEYCQMSSDTSEGIALKTDANGHYEASLWPGLYGVEVDSAYSQNYTGGKLTYYEGMTGESLKGYDRGYSVGWPSSYKWSGSNASAQAWITGKYGVGQDIGGMSLSSGNVVADLTLFEKKVSFTFTEPHFNPPVLMNMVEGMDKKEVITENHRYNGFEYEDYWTHTYHTVDYHPETRGAKVTVRGAISKDYDMTGKSFPLVLNELNPGNYTFTYTMDPVLCSYMTAVRTETSFTFFDFPAAGKLPTSFPENYNDNSKNAWPLDSIRDEGAIVDPKKDQQVLYDLCDGDAENGELKFRFYNLNAYSRLDSSRFGEYAPEEPVAATNEESLESQGASALEADDGAATEEESIEAQGEYSIGDWYGIPLSKWTQYQSQFTEENDLHWRWDTAELGSSIDEAVYDDTNMPVSTTYYKGSTVAIYPKEGTYPDSSDPKYWYKPDEDSEPQFRSSLYNQDVLEFNQKLDYDIKQYQTDYRNWYQKEYTNKGFPKKGALYASTDGLAHWDEDYFSMYNFCTKNNSGAFLVGYSTDTAEGRIFSTFINQWNRSSNTAIPDGNVKLYFCAPKGKSEWFLDNINYIRNQENYEDLFNSALWFCVDVPKSGLVNCDINFAEPGKCKNATILSESAAEKLLNPRTIIVKAVEKDKPENIVDVPVSFTIGGTVFSSTKSGGYPEQTCSDDVDYDSENVTGDEWEYIDGGVTSILDKSGKTETFYVPVQRKQYLYEFTVKDDAGNPVNGATVKLRGKDLGTTMDRKTDSSGRITLGQQNSNFGRPYVSGGLTMQNYEAIVSAPGYSAQKIDIAKSDFPGALTKTVTLQRQMQPKFIDDKISMSRKGAFIPGVNYVGGTTNQIEFLTDTVLGLNDNPLYMTVEAQVDTGLGDALQEVYLVDKKAFSKADFSDKPKAVTVPSTEDSSYNPSEILSWIEKMRSGDLGNVYYRRFSSDGGFTPARSLEGGGSHYELAVDVPIWELPPDGFEACLIAVTANQAVQVYHFDYSKEAEKEQLVGIRLEGDKAKVLNNITLMANAQAAGGSMAEKLVEITSSTGSIFPMPTFEAGVSEEDGYLTYEYKLGVKILEGAKDVSGAESAYLSIAPSTLGVSVSGDLSLTLDGQERELTDGYNVTVEADELDMMDYLPPMFEALPVKIEFDDKNPPSGSFTLTDGETYDKNNQSMVKTYTFSANSQVHVNAQVSAFKSMAAVPAVGPVLVSLEKSGALDMGAQVKVAAGADGTYKYTITGGNETEHEVTFTIGAGAGLGLYAKAFGGAVGAEANLKLSGDNDKLEDMVTVEATIDSDGFKLKEVSGKLVADAHIEIETWFINGEKDFVFGELPFKYEFNTETQFNLTPITVRSTMRSRNDFGVSTFNGRPESVVSNLLPIGGYETDAAGNGTFVYTDMSAKGGNVRLQLATSQNAASWNAPVTIAQTDGLIPAFDVISLADGSYLAVWNEIAKADMEKTCPPSVLKYAVGTVSGTTFSGSAQKLETLPNEVDSILRLVRSGSNVSLVTARTAEGALAEKLDLYGYRFDGSKFTGGVLLANDQSLYEFAAAQAGNTVFTTYVSQDQILHTVKWADTAEESTQQAAGFETALVSDGSKTYLACEEGSGLALYQWEGGWKKLVQATSMASPGNPSLSLSDGKVLIGWTGDNEASLYAAVYSGSKVSDEELIKSASAGHFEDVAVFADGEKVRTLAVLDGESESLNAYARIIKEKVTVSFDANGGTGTMSDQILVKDEATALNAAAFTRSGYSFLGWATQAGAASAQYQDKASVSFGKDTVLYAVWKKNEQTTPANPTPTPSGGNNTPTPAVEAVGKTVTDTATKAEYTVTSSDKTAPEVSFSGATDGALKKLEIPAVLKVGNVEYAVTSVEKNACKGNKQLEQVTIGSNVKVIEQSAFENCSNLKSVSMSASVSTIENKAFSGCSSLTSVNTGKNTTSIGSSAFAGCTKLKKATLGSKVSEIGDKAFANCKALTTFTIPKNVKKLGKQIFSGDKKLKKITVKTTKLTDKTVKKKAFKGVLPTATVKVPKKKKAYYAKLFVKRGLPKKAKVK